MTGGIKTNVYNNIEDYKGFNIGFVDIGIELNNHSLDMKNNYVDNFFKIIKKKDNKFKKQIDDEHEKAILKTYKPIENIIKFILITMDNYHMTDNIYIITSCFIPIGIVVLHKDEEYLKYIAMIYENKGYGKEVLKYFKSIKYLYSLKESEYFWLKNGFIKTDEYETEIKNKQKIYHYKFIKNNIMTIN